MDEHGRHIVDDAELGELAKDILEAFSQLEASGFDFEESYKSKFLGQHLLKFYKGQDVPGDLAAFILQETGAERRKKPRPSDKTTWRPSRSQHNGG